MMDVVDFKVDSHSSPLLRHMTDRAVWLCSSFSLWVKQRACPFGSVLSCVTSFGQRDISQCDTKRDLNNSCVTGLACSLLCLYHEHMLGINFWKIKKLAQGLSYPCHPSQDQPWWVNCQLTHFIQMSPAKISRAACMAAQTCGQQRYAVLDHRDFVVSY